MARRLKGEGSLYQTKDKTWVCQYYGDDGKRHTKRFQRKVDGRAFLDGLRQDEPTAMLPEQTTALSIGNQSSELTVGAWMGRWLETYARPSPPSLRRRSAAPPHMPGRSRPPPEVPRSLEPG